jgi:sortase A
MKRPSLPRLDRILFVVGATLVVIAVAARFQGELSAHLALKRFAAAQSEARSTALSSDTLRSTPKADTRLWSAERIRGYVESLVSPSTPPLAILRIPKLQLEVPVFDGTDDLTLNRGAGRISGTARLGEVGNLGIAGHRDGFFRGLKDVVPGDAVEMETPRGIESYVITGIKVTTPEDVSVLRPTGEPSLTLVTCYPFYFVGSAPQRYIVHASIRATDLFETISQKSD